jgi:hypothetical protein
MNRQFLSVVFVCALTLGARSVFAVGVTTVLPGYDLFQTDAGTQFMGQPFTGVPVGTYNFGGTIGVQNVGDTDTIIQRLSSTNIPLASIPGAGSPVVPLQMDLLQLVSTTPTTLGGLGPLGLYYITLQSTDATGPVSTGAMTISFASSVGGTFTSALDVFFDIHYGALNGPVVYMSDLTLSNPGAGWSRIAPPGAVQINGANNYINGNNDSEDFWVVPPLIESHPSGAGTHVVEEAQTPEPASLALLLAASGLALRRRRRCA